MAEVLVEQFIASHDEPPEGLVLDFDATDDPVHGQQEGRFFHGYYDGYCFLPLYVFCGDELLVAYLRPSNIDAASTAGPSSSCWCAACVGLAGGEDHLRGDSGFCRWRLMRWCDRNGVGYVLGLARTRRWSEPRGA